MTDNLKKMISCTNKNITRIILALIIFISALLSVLIIVPPAVDKYPTASEYNTTIAMEHIYNISKEPHSVFPEDEVAHTAVRNYLIDKSTEYTAGNANASVEEKNYTSAQSVEDDGVDTALPYDIDNVLVKIQGKSDTGILIMGHYDSRGHIGREGEAGGSYGAADDGYALATMLEVIRLYGQKTDLENSIYVLFTDGEETGLYGAKAELKYNTALMDDVNFVLNIEARGSTGAAYMFETGANNYKSMQFYNTTQDTVTWSLATAVYQLMPNSSDFTPYVEAGYAGFNFACLDNLEVYHTPSDNYENVNSSTLGHYANQILPLVNEYTSSAKYSDLDYFKSSENAVAFSILPGSFVMYNFATSIVLFFLTLALVGTLVFFKIKDKKTDWKKLLISTAKVFGLMLAAFAFGYIVANLAAAIAGVNFGLTYTRITDINYVLYLSVLAFVVLAIKMLKNKSIDERNNFAIGTLVINTILGFLTTFFLSGASFTFVVPALLLSAGMLGGHFIKNRFAAMPEILALAVNFLLFVPIIYTLYIALTVGALGIVLLLAICPIISCVTTVLNNKELSSSKKEEIIVEVVEPKKAKAKA